MGMASAAGEFGELSQDAPHILAITVTPVLDRCDDALHPRPEVIRA
jgi:hypothetical protein